MHLLPLYLAKHAEKGNIKKAVAMGLKTCIECGTCTYNCPGRLPLTPTFKMGKAMLKANDAKMRAKAEAAAAKK